MKKTKDYFKYEVANGLYETIVGVDTLEEAREIVENFKRADKAYGAHDDYHIYRVNEYTGSRLKEV